MSGFLLTKRPITLHHIPADTRRKGNGCQPERAPTARPVSVSPARLPCHSRSCELQCARFGGVLMGSAARPETGICRLGARDVPAKAVAGSAPITPLCICAVCLAGARVAGWPLSLAGPWWPGTPGGQGGGVAAALKGPNGMGGASARCPWPELVGGAYCPDGLDPVARGVKPRP